MKKVLIISLIALFLASCGNSNTGELVGTRKNSKLFYQPDPYGMVFVPMGSYTMGVGGEDRASGYLAPAKTISVASFFMDETEITNNEYREFVYWVRDSLIRQAIGEVNPEFLISENPKTGEQYDPPHINWDVKIDWDTDDQTVRDAMEPYYIPKGERYCGRKEIDSRKLKYDYYWINLHAAAHKVFEGDKGDKKFKKDKGYDKNKYKEEDEFKYNKGYDKYKDDGHEYSYMDASFANRPQGMIDRSVYLEHEIINVYPDTLAWIHDYTYALNDPLTELYFWHVAYDNYPVVGVNWNQARAFCAWRTEKLNRYMHSKKGFALSEYRLPTEFEWEWAARGGHTLNPYPWGGPYTRNEKGCLAANFKPLRGNYIADGGLTTVVVGHYPANDWGLYDMAGNVAEWTLSAYDPLSYNFTWDMNPNYTYNAEADEDPIMKRKVIRGGSWKDIAYYTQVSTRSYEYQDSAKCYIGFRCVRPYLGRNKGDDPSKSSRVYR